MRSAKNIAPWVLPFVLFFIGTLLSLLFQTPQGTSLFYLPIPLALVLVQWWGLRILPALILNSVIALIVWDSRDFTYWPLLVGHETATALASWYFFRVWMHGKPWLPNLKHTLSFLLLGIIIPVTVNAIFIFLFSNRQPILVHTVMVWAADFASSFIFCLPMLYFFTPWMEKKKLIPAIGAGGNHLRSTLRLLRSHRTEAIISVVMIPMIALFLPMQKYWFIYGVFSFYIAVRFGFGNTLLVNTLVFFIVYILPFIVPSSHDFSWAVESNIISVHLGMILLSVSACIAGRVISDLRSTERKLQRQFQQLENAHHELDKFVYSASHDLSAPLKSILGLIHVSRMEPDPSRHLYYINKMETSVQKLENYIHEILDYSKNNRTALTLEKINLFTVVNEVLDDLAFNDGYSNVQFHFELEPNDIVADRARLKIVLNNLLSNSIQYRRLSPDVSSSVWIRSHTDHKQVAIEVRDNGQGIRTEVIEKIFTMFFRGSLNSSGSGLGLYIAREAAHKMNGEISVRSVYGVGSTFTMTIPRYYDFGMTEAGINFSIKMKS